jgi:EAL domain-containing protein (putative c-di-GMP-specific phosphodiesterase class I)
MIRDALDHDRLKLFIQPMFEVGSRRPVTWEVLVTLIDAAGKVRFPAEFIQQAESLDLIQKVDQKVAQVAMARWRKYHRCRPRYAADP